MPLLPSLRHAFAPSADALIMTAAASCLYALNALTLQLPQIPAACAGLALYGLAGCYTPIFPRWRKGAPLAVLSAAALPLLTEFHSGFGFYLRVLTAHLTETLLQAAGVEAVSAMDVILVENAAAHVDAPCSGLKSAGVGSLFFAAAVLLNKTPLSLRTAALYALFLYGLLCVNVMRVLILTFTALKLHRPEIAEFLHTPLGLIGFILCCAGAWRMLQRIPRRTVTTPTEPKRLAPLLFGLGLAACLAASACAFWLQQTEAAPPVQAVLHLPEAYAQQPMPLTPAEERYFARSSRSFARKWRFTDRGAEGSVLLTESRDVNRFHPPELCMTAAGLPPERMATVTIGANAFVRMFSLEGGKVTGIYWLQSGKDITDSFSGRLFRYLFDRQHEWRLVFILVKRAVPFTPKDAAAFVTTFQPILPGPSL